MSEITPQDPEADWGRDRKKGVAECHLSPDTLVGSWCHRLVQNQMVWQGIVVCEPQAGVYLIEMLDQPGQRGHQVLVSLPQMLEEGWRFYDSDELMHEAYAHWNHEKESA